MKATNETVVHNDEDNNISEYAPPSDGIDYSGEKTDWDNLATLQTLKDSQGNTTET